eukprot:TRINITY_DN31485_c0_g1_i1.p1 TRINITY_DN31485_c0_g1~~TRINITY_DN31485_c0_g1_i1.p1  ORF type:complete len:283 (+),score=54.75 TRINITY_DN31485_c0_g1_i1:125-973(+)
MASARDCLYELTGSIDDDLSEFDEDVGTFETFEEETVFSPKVKSTPAFAPTLTAGECSICFDRPGRLLRLGAGCAHEFCAECLVAYVTGKVRNADVSHSQHAIGRWRSDSVLDLAIEHVAGVRCPHFDCRCIIDEAQIRTLVDAETVERLDRHLFDGALDAMRTELRPCPLGCGNFLQDRCLCATSACRRVMLKQRRDASALERRRAELAARPKLPANSRVRLCPKCSSLIEKDGGCDHMFCTRCQTNFLWSGADAPKRPEFAFQRRRGVRVHNFTTAYYFA